MKPENTVLHFMVFDLNKSITNFLRQTALNHHGQPAHNEPKILSVDMELEPHRPKLIHGLLRGDY